MKRWLKRLGLAVSLAAASLLAFHVDHAEADHSNPAHHCCPCHFYSVTPEQPAALPAPSPLSERRPQVATLSARLRDAHQPGAARAPPIG